jgi:UDP-N-acetylmuramoyl-tripeptide--D-alanyl-D-alanine ligase
MLAIPAMTNLAHIHALLPNSQLHNIGIAEARDRQISQIGTDSRHPTVGELFVALKGDRFDAHQFLNTVSEQGASAALISEKTSCPTSLPAVYVEDTRKGLGELAAAWRAQYSLPLVAVTGSNGKTTVKEMIAAIFRQAISLPELLVTEGNLNNDIGLPLTLLKLRPSHRLAVIELGMNHPGETAELAAITRPTIALINNAQREHQEFMETVDAVAREHADVLRSLGHNGVGVFPADTPYTDLWKSACASNQSMKFRWFDQAPNTNLQDDSLISGHLLSDGKIEIRTPIGRIEVQLKTLGAHNYRNALAAATVAVAAEIPLPQIKAGLEQFEPVSGRMQRIALSQSITLINDTYNANPDSVIAAIDTLAALGGVRYLVLGDMGEVGSQGPVFHHEIGKYAAQCGIEHFITIGSLTQESHKAYLSNRPGGDARHFDDMDSLNTELVQNLCKFDDRNLYILVKGSRFMRMERVAQALVKGVNPCS